MLFVSHHGTDCNRVTWLCAKTQDTQQLHRNHRLVHCSYSHICLTLCEHQRLFGQWTAFWFCVLTFSVRKTPPGILHSCHCSGQTSVLEFQQRKCTNQLLLLFTMKQFHPNTELQPIPGHRCGAGTFQVNFQDFLSVNDSKWLPGSQHSNGTNALSLPSRSSRRVLTLALAVSKTHL